MIMVGFTDLAKTKLSLLLYKKMHIKSDFSLLNKDNTHCAPYMSIITTLHDSSVCCLHNQQKYTNKNSAETHLIAG